MTHGLKLAKQTFVGLIDHEKAMRIAALAWPDEMQHLIDRQLQERFASLLEQFCKASREEAVREEYDARMCAHNHLEE